MPPRASSRMSAPSASTWSVRRCNVNVTVRSSCATPSCSSREMRRRSSSCAPMTRARSPRNSFGAPVSSVSRTPANEVSPEMSTSVASLRSPASPSPMNPSDTTSSPQNTPRSSSALSARNVSACDGSTLRKAHSSTATTWSARLRGNAQKLRRSSAKTMG